MSFLSESRSENIPDMKCFKVEKRSFNKNISIKTLVTLPNGWVVLFVRLFVRYAVYFSCDVLKLYALLLKFYIGISR